MDSISTGQPQEPLGSPRDLEQRLAVIQPTDTARGFLYNSALELVETQVGPAALKSCNEVLGGKTQKAFFTYPMGSLLKLLHCAADALSDKYGGFEPAMQHLGFRATPGFLESAAGKMLMSLVGKEPRRLFEGLPTAYKTAFNHGACELTWLGPQQGRFVYTGNTIPYPYFVGSVHQVFSTAQMTRVSVRGQQLGPAHCVVDFSWE
jgi:uncharacterized protein (TIGR02265 family)